MIPEFNEEGNLPHGIHEASMDEVETRFGYNAKRQWLLEGLRVLIVDLKKSGCSRIFLDGSFVTKKDVPGDYDLCWSVEGVTEMSVDKRLVDLSPQGRAIHATRYRGDIFPAEVPEGRSGKLFIEFFMTDKNTGNPKGIVSINIGDDHD